MKIVRLDIVPGSDLTIVNYETLSYDKYLFRF